MSHRPPNLPIQSVATTASWCGVEEHLLTSPTIELVSNPIRTVPDTLQPPIFTPISAPVVRIRSLWLPPHSTPYLDIPKELQTPVSIARRAVAYGLSIDEPSPQGKLTQHALMVAWGEFAIELGLIDKLREISIPQKSVVHTPQAKVLTFLMGTLCGITHLKDLNEGPHPLAHDF